jgi:magnesium chelatase subunit D
LAAGIEAAARLADGLRRRGDAPTLVILTDGGANVSRTAGRPGRAAAQDDALAAPGAAGRGASRAPRGHLPPGPAPGAGAGRRHGGPLPAPAAGGRRRALRRRAGRDGDGLGSCIRQAGPRSSGRAVPNEASASCVTCPPSPRP